VFVPAAPPSAGQEEGAVGTRVAEGDVPTVADLVGRTASDAESIITGRLAGIAEPAAVRA